MELIVIRIVNGYAWSLVSLRAINEKLITLRGQLGRRAGSENVSMEALGGNVNNSDNSLGPKILPPV